MDTAADSAYQAVIGYTAEGRLLAADIALYANGEQQAIYQITAKKAVNG
jgi:hypothetical protein